MKKILALALALALMSTTVHATNMNAAGDHASEVTATYVDGNGASPIVYSVDITWDDLSFTYYEASAASWDPVNHKYNSDARAAGWAAEDVANVEIVSHSNTDILANFAYTANSGYTSAEMNFNATQLYLASAEDGSAKMVSNQVRPSGTLPKGTEDAVIGSITITIAQCQDVEPHAVMSWTTDRKSFLYVGKDEGSLGQHDNIVYVDSADEVPTGTKYVLNADFDEMLNNLSTLETLAALVQNGDYDQATLNKEYYETKAEFDAFEHTKVYTKA